MKASLVFDLSLSCSGSAFDMFWSAGPDDDIESVSPQSLADIVEA
jgi:hypothetical protein